MGKKERKKFSWQANQHVAPLSVVAWTHPAKATCNMNS